jgi:hypothetical protein
MWATALTATIILLFASIARMAAPFSAALPASPAENLSKGTPRI